MVIINGVNKVMTYFKKLNFSQQFQVPLFLPYQSYSSSQMGLAKGMRQAGVSLVFPSSSLDNREDVSGSNSVSRGKIREGKERSEGKSSGHALEPQFKSLPDPEAKIPPQQHVRHTPLFFTSRFEC